MKAACQRCGARFEGDRCPRCGTARSAGENCLLKTSTILISTSGDDGVYRSMEDVPQQLRSKLLKSTTGANAGTILIADHNGRKELARALRKTGTSERNADAPDAASDPAGGRAAQRWWWACAAITMLFGLILLWLFFSRP